MKFVVLDDFPLWSTYLLALVVLGGFLFAVAMLIRPLLVSNRFRSGRQSWFFVIAGAVAVWFLGSSMYLRFHAVGIGPREIELIFFWSHLRSFGNRDPTGNLSQRQFQEVRRCRGNSQRNFRSRKQECIKLRHHSSREP